jgi:Tol biopolymer transport system component
MSILSASVSKFSKSALGVVLIGVCLAGCVSLTKETSFTNTLPLELPTEKLAFTFRRCERDDADIRLLTLPGGDVTAILEDPQDDREPVWSPNDQMMGVLSYGVNKRTLRVVDASVSEVYTELGDFIYQFAWSTDGTRLFFLEREGNLHEYNLMEGKNEHIVGSVSDFSVSPNGQWLGLSIRDPAYSGAFTFRVLDLDNGRLLTTLDRNDVGRLGSNHSVWSPTANEVAVLIGANIVIYTVQEDHLHIEATVDARDTYQRDFGRDLLSVAFTDLAWSPDGQQLLIIRSTTDARLGGEALLFDAALSDYQRLLFGENVTEVAWTKDGKWLAYVTSNEEKNAGSYCSDRFRGEIWLANMETLKTQIVVTSTLSIYPPAWRP